MLRIKVRLQGNEFVARAAGHGNVAYGLTPLEAQTKLQHELSRKQAVRVQPRYRRATLTSELVATRGRLYYNQKRQQTRW